VATGLLVVTLGSTPRQGNVSKNSLNSCVHRRLLAYMSRTAFPDLYRFQVIVRTQSGFVMSPWTDARQTNSQVLNIS